MDRVIQIQRNTPSQDAYGEEVASWVTVATVWAERRDLRGAEQFAALQEQAEISTIYRTRWQSGITPEDRVIDEMSRQYDIVAALEIGRREGLDLYVTARAE